jgi:hypothetical protein
MWSRLAVHVPPSGLASSLLASSVLMSSMPVWFVMTAWRLTMFEHKFEHV